MCLLHPSEGTRGNFCRTDPSKHPVLKRKSMFSVDELQEGQTQMAEKCSQIAASFCSHGFQGHGVLLLVKPWPCVLVTQVVTVACPRVTDLLRVILQLWCRGQLEPKQFLPAALSWDCSLLPSAEVSRATRTPWTPAGAAAKESSQKRDLLPVQPVFLTWVAEIMLTLCEGENFLAWQWNQILDFKRRGGWESFPYFHLKNLNKIK